MAEILKTNICCLDLTQDCLEYLKSLDLNLYKGSIGSVFSVNWEHVNHASSKPVLIDTDLPENLHEYHVFIHDMGNPHSREYKASEHSITEIKSDEPRHLVCRYPISVLDLRPYGSSILEEKFHEIQGEKRIEIIFVGHDVVVSYFSDVIGGYKPRGEGTFSILDGWRLVTGKEKRGNRVRLEDNSISKMLFDGIQFQVNYSRVFSLPASYEDEEYIVNKHYLSLLKNESGECISYAYYPSKDYIKFVLPQVEDKASLLKNLFENVIFKHYSDFFPDIEARCWIHNELYQIPDERSLQNEIIVRQAAFSQEIKMLEERIESIHKKYHYLKELLTASGSELVKAVKSFLEWLGFENVIDKDETLKDDELKEEDLCFNYSDNLILIEVKGINGTSTDSECSQVDKVVFRRMHEMKTTSVHGVYIVNNQKNIEPLKRKTPPFKETQIKDALNQRRTMIYTPQLFALYSDIENGYITKDDAKNHFILPGLADFHDNLINLGIPYDFHQNNTIICLDLQGIKVSIGDIVYYKDNLNRLVGCKVENIQQSCQDVISAEIGKTGIKLDQRIPRNKEIFLG